MKIKARWEETKDAGWIEYLQSAKSGNELTRRMAMAKDAGYSDAQIHRMSAH